MGAVAREDDLPAIWRNDEEKLVTRVLILSPTPGRLYNLEFRTGKEQARGRRAT
ncbi:hypothetical protein ACLESO_01245 [Pyxidicoccus sp. 3LG]